MANIFRVNTIKLTDNSTINSGQLNTTNGILSVDFNNLILTGGQWNAQGITISGSSVVLANQTGSFVGNGTTGQLTGIFYPLTGNPSGFIVSSQTGNFASTVNLSTTGNTLQGEITTLNNLTGGFVLTGHTGNFITTSQTGAFYPSFGNPSGFVTTGQTGAFGGGGITTGYASGNSNYLYLPPVTNTGIFPTGNYTIDWSKSDHFYITLTGNTTFTFTNTQDAMTIILISADTGSAYNITLPTGMGTTYSGIKWPGGTGFIPIQTSGQTDIYTFTQANTTIYASVIQNY